MHALGTGYARKSGEPLGFRPKEGTCASTGAQPPSMTRTSRWRMSALPVLPGAALLGATTQVYRDVSRLPSSSEEPLPVRHSGNASGKHTYDFSSCFFRKFKKSAKRGFSREMNYSFGFYGPKIGGGGPPTQLLSTNIKNPEIWPIFGVFVPALGWSCRTVLHTSVPA